MPLLTFYFQLHQPFRLHPDRDTFLWDEMNESVFRKVSDKCYLPALAMFRDLIRDHRDFKITLGTSGTFLEQAELYRPEVIGVLRELLDAGKENNQVEILGETYYHSLAGLFGDPRKREFRDQVALHGRKLQELFGVTPTSFRNTELMYNNDIATVVWDLGYRSILCEKRDDMYTRQNVPVSPNAVFRARGTGLVVLPRNRDLSDDVAFRFPHHPLKAEDYAESIGRVDGESVVLGYDFEHIGEHIWEDRGIFDFWKHLPRALSEHQGVIMANPTEVADRFRDAHCPELDIHSLATSSWADVGRDTFGWLGTMTQYKLFQEIERLEAGARRMGGELLWRWRNVTTSDHIYFLHERVGEDHAVHSYFNPYGGSITQASHVLTRKVDDIDSDIKENRVRRKKEQTALLLIAPETGRLPEHMSALARYISGKSGGLGEVVTALCEGLIEREVDIHLATLNLKKRFQRESRMDEGSWREIRYRIDPDKIHLISSSFFADLPSAYAGNPLQNAAEYQREMVNNVIKEVRAKSGGRLIIHSHDWMAGGAITAYANSRQIPVLHTVHNVFTGHIPLDMLYGVDLKTLADLLFYSEEYGRTCVDCQATAVKNATLINFVGHRFLEEVVQDYFMDRHIVPAGVRQEVKEKYYHGSALAIINAPGRVMYPEHCDHLAVKYGPDDDVLSAKTENLLEFQKRTGLQSNPEAILFFWPSRLDPVQKGVHLLEEIALRFVIENGDVQIAIVGDGVGGDRSHEEALGRIAWASGGKICYYHFDEGLSMLGFAAANDVFGASLYEPCGQIDQVGNLFGATATNRDTGGYHDKIREIRLAMDGAPGDGGNGFLFQHYDAGGLWYGLSRSTAFHRRPRSIREPQIRRIMREARQQYDLDTMIDRYMAVYERLNGGKPL